MARSRGRGRRPRRLGRSWTGCAGRRRSRWCRPARTPSGTRPGCGPGWKRRSRRPRRPGPGFRPAPSRPRLMRGRRVLPRRRLRRGWPRRGRRRPPPSRRRGPRRDGLPGLARPGRPRRGWPRRGRRPSRLGWSWTGCAGPRRSRWCRPARTPSGTRPGCGPGWKRRSRRPRRPGPGFRPGPSRPRLMRGRRVLPRRRLRRGWPRRGRRPRRLGRSWTGCAGPRSSRWRRPARTPSGTRPGCGPGWKRRSRRPRRPGPGFRPAPSRLRRGWARRWRRRPPPSRRR